MSLRSNIVLIGMPGSGKSTIGVVLAKQTACAFVDTDLLIQEEQGCPLQTIVDTEGHLKLRKIEESVICRLRISHAVIATGGSAVYSSLAMRHLKQNSVIVFLDVPLQDLRRRISDYDTRGIAREPQQSFEDLFHERRPLYQKYADIQVSAADSPQESICRSILDAIPRLPSG